MKLYNILKLAGIFLVAVTNGIIIMILLRFSITSFAEGSNTKQYINQPGTISDSHDSNETDDVHSQTIKYIEQIATKSALLIQQHNNDSSKIQYDTDSSQRDLFPQQQIIQNHTYHTTNHTTETVTQVTNSTDASLSFAEGLELMDDTVRLKINSDHFMIDGTGLSLIDDPQLWHVDDSLLFEQDLLKVNTSSISRNEFAGTLSIENGGTGATSTSEARLKLGLVANGSGDIWVNRDGDRITGSLEIRDDLRLGEVGRQTSVSKAGLLSGDEFYIGTTGAFRVQRKYSNSEAFRVQIEGDSQGRLVGTSDGRFRWGDGTNSSDISLRRGESGMLWLEGGIVFNNLQQNHDVVIKGTSDSNLLYAHSSLNRIGIGTKDATNGKLHLFVNGETGLYIANTGSSDSIQDDSGARLTADGIWTDASDRGKKTEITDLKYGLTELMKLRPVQYRWRSSQQPDIGFIAQEVATVLPELVFGKDGNMSLSYGHITALLTESIQEQQRNITQISDRFAEFETRLQKLEELSQKIPVTSRTPTPAPANETPVEGSSEIASQSADTISSRSDEESPSALPPTSTTTETYAIERGINVKIQPEQQSIDITFPNPRPTTSYVVSVSPSWLTHHAVTTKTADGFTVAFSEPPTEESMLDWIVVE